MNIKLISLRGRHFKVYNPDNRMVLEHPSVTEEVDVCFNASVKDGDPYLIIEVTSFIETKMRVPGQHPRADLYILAEHGKRISESIERPIDIQPLNEIKQSEINVSFGNPIARFGRQSVPKVECLYKYTFQLMEAPFSNGLLKYGSGKGALDLERPGEDQTKWKNEGGSIQLHFSFFHPIYTARQAPSKNMTFYAYIPWKHAKRIGEICKNLPDI
jgi:hypothetical protein